VGQKYAGVDTTEGVMRKKVPVLLIAGAVTACGCSATKWLKEPQSGAVVHCETGGVPMVGAAAWARLAVIDACVKRWEERGYRVVPEDSLTEAERAAAK
jgi:hypothetical protein